MSDILDYARSNHKPMTEEEFNSVDALILSVLSYIEWDKIKDLSDEQLKEAGLTRKEAETVFGKGGKGLTLKQMILLFEKTKFYMEKYAKGDKGRLLEILKENKRYSDIVVSNYDFKNVPKPDGIATGEVDEIEQFGALTFSFRNKGQDQTQNYIAFRGTDGTMEGWNEDFLMAFESETAAQRASVEYLSEIIPYLNGDIRMGGHSKGGNDSNYAYLFCSEEIRARIIKLYAFDAPGFIPGITYQGKRADLGVYKKMLELLNGTAVAPFDSIIGNLLVENGFIFIDTNGPLLKDHDAFTWQIDIDNNGFIAKPQSELSKYMDDVTDRWIGSLPAYSRKAFVNTIWTFLYQLGPERLDDIGEKFKQNPLESVNTLFLVIRTLPPNEQMAFRQAFAQLVFLIADEYFEHYVDGYLNVRESIISKLHENNIYGIMDLIVYLAPNPLERLGDLVMDILTDPMVLRAVMVVAGEVVLANLLAYLLDVISIIYVAVYETAQAIITAVTVIASVVQLMIEALKQWWAELKQLASMAVEFVREKIHEIAEAVRTFVVDNYQFFITGLCFSAAKLAEGVADLAAGVEEVVMKTGRAAAKCLDYVVRFSSPFTYGLVRAIAGMLQEPVRIDMARLQKAVDEMNSLARKVENIDSRLNSLYGKLCRNNIEQSEGIFTSLANMYHLASADIKVDQGYRIRRKANGLSSLFDGYRDVESWAKQQL